MAAGERGTAEIWTSDRCRLRRLWCLCRARHQPRLLRWHVVEVVVPAEGALQKIVRYEPHLPRQVYQPLHELEALQARRGGQAAPLARLDMNGDLQP